MLRRFAATFLALLAVFVAVPRLASADEPQEMALLPQAAGDVVLILPFENTSGQKEFNWVGESFADALADLLGSHGLRVVSSDARELAYQRLRLPLTVIPSRATSIKLAREAGATMVVLGTYEVAPARDEKSVAEVHGSARIIRINEGRIAGKQMPDGRWATHEFFFGDALLNLQTVQGKLTYQILYEQDDKLPYSERSIVEQATKVPPKSFEARVKATMTADRDKKLAYLTNAMREFEKANPGSIYKEAAFELGELYYTRTPPDYKKAAEYFSMLQRRDPHYAEAAFYAALAYWRAGELQSALDILLPLTTDVPLTSIYNNAGALSTQAARAEKSADKRENLVKQATNFLSRAVESEPDDAMVRFNYAYALMLSSKYAEAADQLKEVVKQNPKDPEALFLLAKAQEKAGQADAAAANDNEARKLYPGYGRAQVEWEKSQTAPLIGLRLRGDIDRTDLVTITDPPPDISSSASTQDLLAKARDLYTAGRDDEALMELRDVVRIEPMNAEAYLLTGRIYQRRGELASAINQLKTSIFWDTDHKLIDAHILLGRIFLERGDRAQATAYAQSAMQIDPNNQEAIALKRQLQAGIK
ncbi:MAG TPA: tetratricopeptide repeat protein [Pyrinomonadaceae bacterium]|nr:tetratricopeptide repeat protein [Pyrinomonadaceae bacterium]